jgi:Fe-S-cluster containining protein
MTIPETKHMTGEFPILKHHTIRHVPRLRVNPAIFEKRFAPGCSMTRCDATCCHGGVFADLAERDRVLAHAELIKSHMEPGQERDTAKWFDGEVVDDIDFPSGKAVGTQTNARGCIFLKENGHCVLQSAATEARMGKFAIKPFFCVAFPVVIAGHELTLHDDYTGRTECCFGVANGSLSLVDVCAEELEFMLGAEGFRELVAMGESFAGKS